MALSCSAAVGARDVPSCSLRPGHYTRKPGNIRWCHLRLKVFAVSPSIDGGMDAHQIPGAATILTRSRMTWVACSPSSTSQMSSWWVIRSEPRSLCAILPVTAHPELRLALIAPTTPCLTRTQDNPDGVDPGVFERMRSAFMSDFPGTLANNIRPFVTPETSPALTEWIMRMMSECSLKSLIDCNRHFTSADFRSELPALRLPTLVLQGDADASAPLDLTGRKTAALMPHSTLKIYAGAPHGLIFTHKTRVNEDLAEFARS